jgi:hypothetical protein
MTQPRKYTNEMNRERALEILALYESGVKPKQLSDQFGMDVEAIWQRIKLARRTRQRRESERELLEQGAGQ